MAFVGNASAQSAACAANEVQQNLNASTYAWTAGSTSYSATVGSGAAGVVVTGSVTGGNFASGYPATDTANFGGIAPSFAYSVDRSNTTQNNTITFNFTKPVNKLVITASDLDRYTRGGTYADMVTITGTSPTGTTVNPTGTAASNLITISGNAAYPSGSATSNTNCDVNDTSCNATFSFATPITTLTVVYSNNAPPASGNPPAQRMDLMFGGFCVQNPDPGITKTAPATALVGTAFDFTLQANNAGSAAAPVGVQVNDTIDAGKYTINSITPAAGWTCARVPNSAFPINSGSIAITCTSTATISAGASGVGVATVNVTPKEVAAPGPITNTATIPAGSGGDISTANNSSSTSTTLKVPTDLSITKSNGPAGTPVVSGQLTTYTIVVSNAGPAPANNSIVKDTPGTGLNAASCATTCTGTTGGASCPTPLANVLTSGATIATFPANSTVTLSVTCTVN